MKFSGVAVIVLLMGCEVPEPAPPVPPGPLAPPKPEPTTPEPVQTVEPPTPVIPSCSTACNVQRRLGCILGENTSEGATCEVVCANSFESGVPQLYWDVGGLTNATECSDDD